MSKEFKVMPWLRALRNGNAEDEKNMTHGQILQRIRKRSEKMLNRYLETHRDSKPIYPPKAVMTVGEAAAEYKTDKE